MATPVEKVLHNREQQGRGQQRRRALVVSLLLHGIVVAGWWLTPKLLAKPPKKPKHVNVLLVPPAVLGAEKPPPPPPKRQTPPEAPPPKAKVETPPPPKPTPAKDVPVLPTKRREQRKPASTPPPPPPPQVAPSPIPEPRQRLGSATGNPLGVSTSGARIGVEDPSFTYDYYLDRVRAAISRRWKRPSVGAEADEALLYFRIQEDGQVTELELKNTSGSDRFDRTALAAVQAASPLPPLPRSYKKSSLGINLVVR